MRNLCARARYMNGSGPLSEKINRLIVGDLLEIQKNYKNKKNTEANSVG
jgi:hypothetical protein